MFPFVGNSRESGALLEVFRWWRRRDVFLGKLAFREIEACVGEDGGGEGGRQTGLERSSLVP